MDGPLSSEFFEIGPQHGNPSEEGSGRSSGAPTATPSSSPAGAGGHQAGPGHRQEEDLGSSPRLRPEPARLRPPALTRADALPLGARVSSQLFPFLCHYQVES